MLQVIYIQAFICVWISGKIMRKIFFGQLRTTEFEVTSLNNYETLRDK